MTTLGPNRQIGERSSERMAAFFGSALSLNQAPFNWAIVNSIGFVLRCTTRTHIGCASSLRHESRI